MDIQFAGERTIKRFRVAREGQTVDGRTLSKDEIIEMAESYNPTEYTARINVEHMGSFGLDATNYPALGDVIAVDYEIQNFVINGQNTELACLYATLSALPVLIEINRQGKKLFTSIEFYKKFADTDKAYLVGLAVTDTPASRGTEPLKFTQKNSFLSDPVELIAMHTEKTEPAPAADGFIDKLKTVFHKKTLTESDQAVIIDSFSTLNQRLEHLEEQQNSKIAELEQKLTAQSATLTALQTNLSATPNATTDTNAVGVGHQLTEF